MGDVAAMAVKIARDRGGAPAARKLYARLLQAPPAGGAFFHALIDMELSLQGPERLPDSGLRRLFEVQSASHN